MGINNKQRRRMKQAKRQERRRAAQDGYGPTRAQHGWREEGVDLMIDLAIEAAIQSHDPGKAPQLAVLVKREAGIRARVVSRLQSWLAEVHRAALRRGWHTDEMALVARRGAGASAADLVRGLVDGAPATLDPSAESWPATVAAAVSALAVMAHLPPLPDLGAVRRGAPPGVDERLLARVRALLAKAESTDFPEEAEACLAKAQALMARHSLDRLAVEGRGAGPCPLDARRLWLDDPYLQAKALLAGVVASANRCRAIVSAELGFVTLVGRHEDLDATELLFTSLLVHATDRMTTAAQEAGSGALATRSRRPSFRRSFLVAYANRIGARLREAAEAALAEADREHGPSLLPVLAR
ncbi:MAG TPA: DUF2786 domain-containing protein, partial [Acidimicrobiales bacterium]|nr:DUF2786 domain-containing protein [Acidimicrobiales bacterium]